MSADSTVVSARGVSKTFGKGGVTALQGIDLDVERGEFISLIGPSGCGKSTLLRVVGDLVEPTAGEILVNGKALGPTVVSNQQLQIMLTTGVIAGPGQYNVKVMTPSGNVGDVGCSSGGTSSGLTLTVQ